MDKKQLAGDSNPIARFRRSWTGQTGKMKTRRDCGGTDWVWPTPGTTSPCTTRPNRWRELDTKRRSGPAAQKGRIHDQSSSSGKQGLGLGRRPVTPRAVRSGHGGRRGLPATANDGQPRRPLPTAANCQRRQPSPTTANHLTSCVRSHYDHGDATEPAATRIGATGATGGDETVAVGWRFAAAAGRSRRARVATARPGSARLCSPSATGRSRPRRFPHRGADAARRARRTGRRPEGRMAISITCRLLAARRWKGGWKGGVDGVDGGGGRSGTAPTCSRPPGPPSRPAIKARPQGPPSGPLRVESHRTVRAARATGWRRVASGRRPERPERPMGGPWGPRRPARPASRPSPRRVARESRADSDAHTHRADSHRAVTDRLTHAPYRLSRLRSSPPAPAPAISSLSSPSALPGPGCLRALCGLCAVPACLSAPETPADSRVAPTRALLRRCCVVALAAPSAGTPPIRAPRRARRLPSLHVRQSRKLLPRPGLARPAVGQSSAHPPPPPRAARRAARRAAAGMELIGSRTKHRLAPALHQLFLRRLCTRLCVRLCQHHAIAHRPSGIYVSRPGDRSAFPCSRPLAACGLAGCAWRRVRRPLLCPRATPSPRRREKKNVVRPACPNLRGRDSRPPPPVARFLVSWLGFWPRYLHTLHYCRISLPSPYPLPRAVSCFGAAPGQKCERACLCSRVRVPRKMFSFVR